MIKWLGSDSRSWIYTLSRRLNWLGTFGRGREGACNPSGVSTPSRGSRENAPRSQISADGWH